MNNESITNIFFKANNKKRIKGRNDTMSALMPYIIMNVVLQMYYKRISKVSCCYNLKRVKNQWSQSYTHFNHSMLCLYNDNQKDYIIDKYDSFENYITEDVEGVQVLVEEGLAENGVPYDKREVLSTCLVCNVLAQSAQCLWKQTYLTSRGNEETNLDIQKVEDATMKFAEGYYASMKNIDLNKFPRVVKAVNALCHKIVAWMGEDAKKEVKKKIDIEGIIAWKRKHDIPKQRRCVEAYNEKVMTENGFEKLTTLTEEGLFKERKPMAIAKDIIREDSNIDPIDYEFVYNAYHEVSRRQKESRLTIYMRKKEEML